MLVALPEFNHSHFKWPPFSAQENDALERALCGVSPWGRSKLSPRVKRERADAAAEVLAGQRSRKIDNWAIPTLCCMPTKVADARNPHARRMCSLQVVVQWLLRATMSAQTPSHQLNELKEQARPQSLPNPINAVRDG